MKSGFSHGLSRIAAKKPSVWCSGGKVRKFSSRSNSSFGLTPGARCGLSAATPKPETRRISRRPRSTSATTCSFSSGSSEQVERSEEHTSELQSPDHLVCRLLLEKKKINKQE